MSEQEEFEARFVESTRSVITVLNDSFVGHARHATDLVSRAADRNNEIDPVRELIRFGNRTVRDGARLFRAIWSMIEALAWKPPTSTTPQPDQPPLSNPRTTSIGPVATTGSINPLALRRRGDPAPTIPASKITVTRHRNQPSQLDLVIEAGGATRGLYEGTLNIGSGATVAAILYNIYVDY